MPLFIRLGACVIKLFATAMSYEKYFSLIIDIQTPHKPLSLKIPNVELIFDVSALGCNKCKKFDARIQCMCCHKIIHLHAMIRYRIFRFRCMCCHF